ncbi:MMPL family transporter [Eubacterium sp.]|uniref:efflux RND transporter permease subunit n=1 Tax=Eubacterium sp. TaxID=142586 RepID=UPI0025FA8ED3|nr:MMPL family transporter [Eubacterium sp.]MCR5629650.1 MMPL family transporter [Eubacterium sp.]
MARKLGKTIVKHRGLIIVLYVLLLIPSIIGYANTRINYDILSYLPSDIETMKGQNILVNEFGSGGFSFFIVDDMKEKDVEKLKGKIEKVEGVHKVIWYDSLMDITVPMELLPDKIVNAFNNGNATMMLIMYDKTTSDDLTMKAIEDIREISNEQCFLSGMSAVVTDTKIIANTETPVYVVIAGILTLIVLGVAMDSFIVPVLFLASIGMSIVYNLGSNIFMGEISYITKALAAVLQLGVTMDYSIFLYNSFKEYKEKFPDDSKRAMAHAISNTIVSVTASSITTVAGFLALCFMSFTLGLDIGIVMIKGVVIGVIECVTLLPAILLLFEKTIDKRRHKPLLPEFKGIAKFVTRKHLLLLVLYIVILIPALHGNNNVDVYYNLDETIPVSYKSRAANVKLNELFDTNSTHMILMDSNLSASKSAEMAKELEKVKGVETVLSYDSFVDPSIPDEFVPDKIKDELADDKWKLAFVFSDYKVASDEVNRQVDELNKIIDKYDEKAMLIGEAPCTKDLIDITDKDFKTVNVVSIGAIFLIILITFKSISLPVILVAVIELAIFINMAISYYTGTTIPFISSVVIGTIQLGATVDYAILMTTRYKKERNNGMSKKEAVRIASSSSAKSIVVSGLSFCAATIGVAIYSKIDMISSLCLMISRGAIISMFCVLLFLPAMFMIFDGLIRKTSFGFK